ncbi:Ltp family lipoprotein [Exiguobacterium sp.]|uniref:Ltp family lipoprotein n=1 Tax=Exiguobacterium sp. TaxID=44751 RepID=UPI00391B704F
MSKEKVKKPFYKKWWVWALAVIVFFGAVSGEDEVVETTTDSTTQSVDAESEAAEEVAVEETPETVEEETVEEEVVEKEPAEPTMSLAQENAVRKANDYLKFTAFSKNGLIDQLEFEGFSNEEATFAVDNIVVDWKEQAASKAQDYLDLSAFSRSGLIDQLEFEGFTTEEATYGVDKVGL